MSVDRHSPGSLCSVLSAQCSVVQVQVVLIGIPCRCGHCFHCMLVFLGKPPAGGVRWSAEHIGRNIWRINRNRAVDDITGRGLCRG